MAIAETLGRIASTVVAIVQTRLELAAVEMEEESLRLLSYLALALLAVICFSMCVMLLGFLVIALFWDSHRIVAILATAGGFALVGTGIGLGVRSSFRRKPKLLSFTLAELNKDLSSMKSLTKSS
ncbi:MAG: phage holin family protein [Pseudomonadota bacterium]